MGLYGSLVQIKRVLVHELATEIGGWSEIALCVKAYHALTARACTAPVYATYSFLSAWITDSRGLEGKDESEQSGSSDK